MSEEFDDRLKSRITEVFDNYEDDSAENGWLLLREKYPEKTERRTVAWLWWTGIAAILMVILGVGIWLNGSFKVVPVKSAVVPSVTKPHKRSHAATDSIHQLAVASHQDNADQAQRTSHWNKATQKPGSRQNQTYAGESAVLTSVSAVKKNDPTSTLNTHQAITNQPDPALVPLNHHQPVQANLIKPNQAITDSNQATAKVITSNIKVKTDSQKTERPVVKRSIEAFLAMQSQDEPKKTAQQADKKVKFGLYAATYFNYSKGSDNEFNVGAGFSSEIKLAGNLKLLTGLAVTQNSLNYKSALPQTANTYLAVSIEQRKVGQYLAMAAPPSGTAVGPQNTAAANPVLRNYQASLIGLDIPVNLKYQFPKSDTYISAGLSSGTYLNETYQFVYSYPALLSSTNASAPLPQNTQTENTLNTFDFARTLNVSFGVGYPLGKTNRLIIEPFLKYPLNGLGSQQLKFGAGGLNLKFNFQTAKH